MRVRTRTTARASVSVSSNAGESATFVSGSPRSAYPPPPRRAARRPRPAPAVGRRRSTQRTAGCGRRRRPSVESITSIHSGIDRNPFGSMFLARCTAAGSIGHSVDGDLSPTNHSIPPATTGVRADAAVPRGPRCLQPAPRTPPRQGRTDGSGSRGAASRTPVRSRTGSPPGTAAPRTGRGRGPRQRCPGPERRCPGARPPPPSRCAPRPDASATRSRSSERRAHRSVPKARAGRIPSLERLRSGIGDSEEIGNSAPKVPTGSLPKVDVDREGRGGQQPVDEVGMRR